MARGPATEAELAALFIGAGLTLDDLSAALVAAGAVEGVDPAGNPVWSVPHEGSL